MKENGSNIDLNNVLIVGLGRIGLGTGEYSTPWNSHFDAARRSLKGFTLYGMDIRQNRSYPSLLKIVDFCEVQRIGAFDIIIDAASSTDRAARIAKLYHSVDFEYFICEKPVSYSLLPEAIINDDRMMVSYPRRLFDSTRKIRDFLLHSEITRVRLKFNNGIKNTLPHFFDFLSSINILFDAKITKTSDNIIVLGGIIEIEKTNFKNYNVFDIFISTNNHVLEYKDFGRSISINNVNYNYSHELSSRYKNLYLNCKPAKLPSLREDRASQEPIDLITQIWNDDQ